MFVYIFTSKLRKIIYLCPLILSKPYLPVSESLTTLAVRPAAEEDLPLKITETETRNNVVE
jgi:hypothetical protein